MQNPDSGAAAPVYSKEEIDPAINRSVDDLLKLQKDDGHWVFELEADATIPAEYILLDHYLGTINQPLHERMADYLRKIQEDHGGWPLYHRGSMNLSATVKAYFALKCVGDDPNAPHMIRARKAILSRGGAERSNVFTRIQLALFGAVPWTAVPVMPVEIMLLPKWCPFHLSKVSYWSRTVIVPLLVLMAKRPRAVNPKGIKVEEIFRTPASEVKSWPGTNTKSKWGPAFDVLDKILRFFEPYMPLSPRQKAIDKAVDWAVERLNGDDGLGGIYPAMANALMMFDCLDYKPEHPHRAIVRQSIDKLVVDKPERTYCQPCLSPVWDTALSVHALMDANAPRPAIEKALDWLTGRQVLDIEGDWIEKRPNVRPGGWAFQYNNAYYPDLDDTAVVIMALDRFDGAKYRETIERGIEWVLGLQSKNGGWGAFDADNTYYYLNCIPFADHGALLDPPSADVTARCLSMLAQLGYKKDHPKVSAAIDYLRREQEPEGCWFGRWGTNYIYGTWSVLCALNAIGIETKDPMVRRAVKWVMSKQRADGGWGESGSSYWPNQQKGANSVSTPTQTAWALIGLMAGGEADSDSVKKGVEWLLKNQKEDGSWDEAYYTAVGFPRVFYLRYHGYKAFFPQWALARYKRIQSGNGEAVLYGM